MVGVAGLSTLTDKEKDEVVLAHWFYELGEFAVNIIYAVEPNTWASTKGAWHPQHGTGRLKVHNFADEFDRG